MEDPDLIVAALKQAVDDGEGATVDVPALVPGALRQLLLFAPGTPASVINDSTYHELRNEARRVEASADSALLVFHYHHGLIEGILISKYDVPFDSSLLGRRWWASQPFVAKAGRLTVAWRDPRL